MTEIKRKKREGHGGIGMPEALWLEEFGFQVYCAFGEYPYQVGSTLFKKHGWKDVDVRLILSDEDYEKMGFGKPNEEEHMNAKWCALVEAFSALGRKMTGLPIDFQIQQQTNANKLFHDSRSALGVQAYYKYKNLVSPQQEKEER
jgi:hypothetical protein